MREVAAYAIIFLVVAALAAIWRLAVVRRRRSDRHYNRIDLVGGRKL